MADDVRFLIKIALAATIRGKIETNPILSGIFLSLLSDRFTQTVDHFYLFIYNTLITLKDLYFLGPATKIAVDGGNLVTFVRKDGSFVMYDYIISLSPI